MLADSLIVVITAPIVRVSPSTPDPDTRALVLGAAPGVFPDPLPPDVFALPFAPFSVVYPRCAAVIHHGGTGSVAQALRAAVPTLVVPWGFDQTFNGTRVAELGVGQWLPRSAYTPDRVAPLLADLLHTPSYRDRARRLAHALTEEHGVQTLCDGLEALLADPPYGKDRNFMGVSGGNAAR